MRYLAAGRSLKFASCRVGLGECSYPRTVTAIHLVAVDRTPNLPIERRTLYHTELMSVEHDTVSGSRSNGILQFRTRSGSDSISKNSTGSNMDTQTPSITAVKCLIRGFFRMETGLDQIFGQYYRIRIGLDCTVRILDWTKIAKISDPFNTRANAVPLAY